MCRSKIYIVTISIAFFVPIGCQNIDIQPESIDVCQHYNCADATIIQVTDQYFPQKHHFVRGDNRKYGAVWAEFLAFKNNIPLHVFEHEIKGKEFENFLNTGRGGVSIYYPSCFIPFRISKLDSIKSKLENIFEKSISTLSYGCDKTSYANILPKYFLGGRNSKFSSGVKGINAITWYGDGYGTKFPKQDAVSYKSLLTRPSGGRFYTDIQRGNMSIQQTSSYVKEQVTNTMNNGGFYTNFMHWHDYYENENDSLIEGVQVMKPLFKAMHDGIGEGINSMLDYNEAIEYLYAKELVGKIDIIEDHENLLQVKIKHKLGREADYSRIDTPVSIKIPNDQIKNFKFIAIDSSKNLLNFKKRSDHIILNVLLDFESNQTNIEVTNDQLKTKLTHIPERKITCVKSWFGGVLNFTQESKIVLFRREKRALEYEVEIIYRSPNFIQKYKLPELEDGYDYFCGAIDRNRQSTLFPL